MRKVRLTLWALVFLALSVILGAKALELTTFPLLFDGWWTLFIIVPCFIDLFKPGRKAFNIVGIVVGTVILLCCQDVLTYKMVLNLIPSVLFFIIGASIIIRDVIGTKTDRIIRNLNKEKPFTKYDATFSSQKVDFDGIEFKGVGLNAVFGDIKCNLTNAFIKEDCVINARSTFGGVTVIVPQGVNVKIKSSTIFGNTTNKCNSKDIIDAPTVYVKSNCIFGSVTVM